MDPGNPPAPGTALTPQLFDFFDNDDDGLIEPNVGDTVLRPGSDPEIFDEITSVWRGDTITVTMGGSTVTITGTTFYIAGQPAIFTPTDGTILDDAIFQSSTFVTGSTNLPVGDLGPPCFTPGTRIATPEGERLVETLRPGDLVLTRDHGAQQLLWIGSRTVDGTGRRAPILFKDGAIENNGDFAVSPNHRMLVTGWRAQLLFGEDDVLVPAKALVDGRKIRVARRQSVTYLHLLFRDHEILFSNGVPTESYFIGHLAHGSEADTRAEVLELFPELSRAMDEQTVAYPTIGLRDARALHA
ncbi:type I secretion protein [Rhodobacterales bacterium HKCCE4037]|nr:type I secretion protein [Rhodobacterales bacterium HKCCE4037]